MSRHRLLYDAECGFCRWSLSWLLRWDRRRALAPVALQAPLAAQLLTAISEQRRIASWHLVAPDGSVTSAGAAAAPLLRLLPGGNVPARLAAAMPGLAARAYELVARNRDLFAKPITAAAQRRADAVVAARTE